MTFTDSGIAYEVLKAGDGANPVAADTVKVHYVGTLIDGTEFDLIRGRGEPATFPLNRVIPGWTEGLQLMPRCNISFPYPAIWHTALRHLLRLVPTKC